MSQTIYKMAGKNDPFARIPHTLLEDERISWEAKGILCYLCGKPDGWKMRVTDLVKRGTAGKHKIRAALNELREFGYAEFVSIRKASGVFSEGVWKVSDTPVFEPRSKKRDADKRDAENQHRSKKELSKNEFSKKQSEETKGTSSSDDALDSSFPAQWIPKDRGTKEEQLKRIKTPQSFPSERQFNTFVETEPLDHICMGKGGDLYHRLTMDKWHKWKNERWHPIRNWKLYISSLDAKMNRATNGEEF